MSTSRLKIVNTTGVDDATLSIDGAGVRRADGHAPVVVAVRGVPIEDALDPDAAIGEHAADVAPDAARAIQDGVSGLLDHGPVRKELPGHHVIAARTGE